MATYILTDGTDAAPPPVAIKKARRDRKAWRPLPALLACVLALVILTLFNLRPALFRVAQAHVRGLGIQTVNSAIHELVTSRADLLDLVTLLRDEEGRIVALQADTAKLNLLSTQAVDTIQGSLSGLQERRIRIPAGALFGPNNPFSAYGPPIVIRVVPAGAVSTQCYSTFTQAGINQTRHQVTLEITTTLFVLLPTGSRPVELVSQVPISDTILIGEVPHYFGGSGERVALLPQEEE